MPSLSEPLTVKEVKTLLRATKGREQKNIKYAFWLGFELGKDKDPLTDKEFIAREILSKKRLGD